MSFPSRPMAFVLTAANHGSMIVNRNDYNTVGNFSYGVGQQILSHSYFDSSQVDFTLALLNCRRKNVGDGIVAIDGGANIGVYSVEWARHMHGWGSVLGFEAQEVVYYALAGNIALNNCLNARVRLAALGEKCGELLVPVPDYFRPASFGSLELRQRDNNEFIGQDISYSAEACNTVPMITIDSLGLERLDFVKLDVEGMEIEVLRGAQSTLSRHTPIMFIEVQKSDRGEIERFLSNLSYTIFPFGADIIAIHKTDPTINRIEVKDDTMTIFY